MTIAREYKTRLIPTLPQGVVIAIAQALISKGLCAEEMDIAMNSRVCDLEDTIQITWRD